MNKLPRMRPESGGSRKHNREVSGGWEESGRDAPSGEANLETRGNGATAENSPELMKGRGLQGRDTQYIPNG